MIRKLASLSLLLALAACDNSSKTQAPATPAAPPAPVTAALTTELPADVKALPAENGGVCTFDDTSVKNDFQHVLGWAASAQQGGKPAQKVYIRVSSPQGDRYALADVAKREDVAKAMNNPDLVNSGFELWLKKADAPTGARFTVYQVDGGKLRACENAASAP
jgi:hypothetical protein